MVAKKLYYKIGEACKILEIQPYVLRYWETEFPFLSPSKSKSGQRVYSDREIDVIRRIKELLYEEGYTIAGAKKKLEGELAADAEGTTDKPKPAAKKGKRRTTGGSAKKPAGGDDGRAEKLQRGIEAALSQAREILQVLQA